MDIIINGEAWRALPPDLQAIVEGVTTQSILEGMMYFVEQNAKALKILVEEKGVNVFDAPPGYSEAFIKSSKKVMAEIEKKDPFFKKVLESQRAYAKLVVPFTQETNKLMLLISGAAEIK
jgi:TRAP-type mannitol/chloroaromatic compound transport system substrate-binding protein